ncbi:PLP-dependent aminotransferase family protein [Paraburkholderia jirisanensis]
MYAFSAPFANPAGSPIRELFRYLGEPGMISFAGGYPAIDLFDKEGLRDAAEAAYADSGTCLQYGPTDGLPALKNAITQLMAQRGTAPAQSELLITTGAQQGFDLLLRVLLEPGDTVLVEQPAYPATLAALRLQQATIRPVGIDADGLDVAALETLLAALPKAQRPKLLYTVPTFANPTGATLSKERRVRLLELAVRYRFVVVEDDPYGDLRFTDERVPSILSLADQVPGARAWVVYLSSLSKIVAPGLRTGWTIGPAEVIRRCVIAKQTADLCSAPWTQSIAARYLESGRLVGHLRDITRAYHAKCQALCNELRTQTDGAIDFIEPKGGMFVWARLRDGGSAADLLKHAIGQKVIFVPGTAFYADNADSATLRLSFAAPSIPEINEGVSRVAIAVRDTAQ